MAELLHPGKAPKNGDTQTTILELVRLSTAEHEHHVETIDSLLRALRQYFDLPLAIASRIDGDTYLVEHVSDATGDMIPGTLLDLPETYCERVISLARPLYVERAGDSLFTGHPCYQTMGLETYIGARIFVDGRVYGTINLTGPDARTVRFTPDDRAVFETGAALIGHHVSLCQAEDRYRLAVEGTDVGLWDWDLVSGDLYWSPRIFDMLGVKPKSVKPDFDRFRNRIHPDDQARVDAAIREHLEERTAYSIEFRLQHTDGHYVWARARGQASWRADGTPVRMAGALEDVTARKTAEEALRVSDERYELAMHGANAGLWDWDVVANKHYWSPRYREIIGITDPDFEPSRKAFRERIHPEDLPRIREIVAQHERSHTPLQLEYRARHEDGHWVHVLARGQGIWDETGRLIRMAGSVEDVSARVRAEEDVRESTHLRRMAGKMAMLGYWHYPLPDGPPVWSDELYRLHGVDREAFDPACDDAMQFVHPDDRDRVAELDRRTLDSDEAQELEYRVVLDGGAVRHFLARSQCQRDESGAAVSLFGVYQDITEAKHARQRDRERARMLALAGQAAKVGYFEVTLATGCVDLSEELYAMFGLDRSGTTLAMDDLVGVTHPDDRDRVGSAIDTAIKSRQIQSLSKRILRADTGEERLVHAWLECFYSAEGEPERLFGVTQDVTDQREVEIRLLEQAAELQRTNQELGRFAFVASHDLQEPLRKVSAFGGMLAKRYGDALDADGRRILDIMVDGAARMQLLIEDLLHYSKSSNVEMQVEPVDLARVFEEVCEALSVSIAEAGAMLELDDMPVVRGDASLLRQLFQNLVSNAIKYRGSETLQIRIRAEQAPDGWLIRVSDNGIGFRPGDSDRIFEMFKRLHGRGQYPGTGIGLALCQRIVERHGGRITAHGKPDVGAEFEVYLPDDARALHAMVAIDKKSPT